MRLHLVDTNPDIVAEWERAFQPFPDVRILNGNILRIAQDTIVSPANSYGFMDGGIDEQYTDFFGLGPQCRLREKIAVRPEGLLPVGAALLVRTGHSRIRWMISAPTMETPGPVPGHNAFYAMAAILNCAERNRNLIKDVFCPGLGTGVGCIPADAAASEMANAFRKFRETKQA